MELNNRSENSNFSPETNDKTSDGLYSKLACLLIENGASLYIKNNKDQTPIDLCNDSSFIKFIIKHNHHTIEAKTQKVTNQINSLSVNKNLDECPICCENSIEVMVKPCNHVAACSECSKRLKKCLICKEPIDKKIDLLNCIVCEDNKASVLIEPCGHVCCCEACSKLLKKCMQCKVPIERQVCILPSKLKEENNERDHNLNVIKLQQQLQDIKEQTMCPVCMDKQKNMVFLCGHGTCQMCGDQMNECPICRKVIQKKILIY